MTGNLTVLYLVSTKHVLAAVTRGSSDPLSLDDLVTDSFRLRYLDFNFAIHRGTIPPNPFAPGIPFPPPPPNTGGRGLLQQFEIAARDLDITVVDDVPGILSKPHAFFVETLPGRASRLRPLTSQQPGFVNPWVTFLSPELKTNSLNVRLTVAATEPVPVWAQIETDSGPIVVESSIEPAPLGNGESVVITLPRGLQSNNQHDVLVFIGRFHPFVDTLTVTP